MPKIIRVITRLNIGGPAIHTILLSSELNKNGTKDILVCGRVSPLEGDMTYFAREKGIEPVVLPDLGRDISPIKDLKSLILLYSIIKKERPDIIHTHTAKAGTIGRIAAIIAGVPVKIHTFHGHIFDGYFNPFKAKCFLFIERVLSMFTNKIITVSKQVEHEIIDELKVAPKKKSEVILLGLELDNFLQCEKKRGSLRQRFGIADDTLLVGIVGRLVPIKNHQMFLDGARAVMDSSPHLNVRFVIIGDGERRDYLKEYVMKKNLAHHVIFTGWVQDLVSAYADLDIVALTSLNEGTPVSLIEAMASSKPVVATDVGGIRDVVDDCKSGFLVASNDVEAFSCRLLMLLNDRNLRENIGSNGRKSVVPKYEKRRLVRDIEHLYAECLNKV